MDLLPEVGMVIPCGTYIGICGCIELLLLAEWKLFPAAAADRLILQQLPAKKVLHQAIQTPSLLTVQLGEKNPNKTPEAEDLFKKGKHLHLPRKSKVYSIPC